MKYKTLIILFSLYSSLSLADGPFYITIDSDAVKDSMKLLKNNFSEVKRAHQISLVEVETEDDLLEISQLMHEKFNRCGGFILHESLEEAKEVLDNQGEREFANKGIFADYSIDQEKIILPLLEEQKENKILETIKELSSLKNRYYNSSTGVEASHLIYQKWKEIAETRSDINVETFKHKWPQDSVILTIQGKNPEKIILGGHLDSISGFVRRERAYAPGADDNASGIASLTEVIRVLVDSQYVPQNTLVFIAYAAEEVGLLGSKEISRKSRLENDEILGVLQLDMTNYQGSDLDIVMMTDYTNSSQNAFIGSLIDRYLKDVRWGYDRCGYGCSDHASWHNQGYAASMPFESRKNDMNRNIHTPKDTLDVSQNNASHALKFSKMALAFLIELDR